ncbi:DNA-binding protein [Streptomyces sp. NPDC006784]|uniref:DNA-binding protein n=1 Tax=Streptomyces sp. NPDC006784 TaxID=3364764 RepID=UPI0036C383DE
MPSRVTRRPTLREVERWPATVSVSEAATAIGISASHLRAQIAADSAPVEVLRFGRAYRVVTASLVDLLSGRAAA